MDACTHTDGMYQLLLVPAHIHVCKHACMPSCMHARMDTYMHTCMHTHIDICMHRHVHACMYVCIHTHTHMHTQPCTSINGNYRHAHARTNAHTQTHTNAHKHTHTHTHSNTHKHTNTQASTRMKRIKHGAGLVPRSGLQKRPTNTAKETHVPSMALDLFLVVVFKFATLVLIDLLALQIVRWYALCVCVCVLSTVSPKRWKAQGTRQTQHTPSCIHCIPPGTPHADKNQKCVHRRR
jgi:hypothetical protein